MNSWIHHSAFWSNEQAKRLSFERKNNEWHAAIVYPNYLQAVRIRRFIQSNQFYFGKNSLSKSNAYIKTQAQLIRIKTTEKCCERNLTKKITENICFLLWEYSIAHLKKNSIKICIIGSVDILHTKRWFGHVENIGLLNQMPYHREKCYKFFVTCCSLNLYMNLYKKMNKRYGGATKNKEKHKNAWNIWKSEYFLYNIFIHLCMYNRIKRERSNECK